MNLPLNYAPPPKTSHLPRILLILLLILSLPTIYLTRHIARSAFPVSMNVSHCPDTIAMTLQFLRSQVECYKFQHGGIPPATSLWPQMLNATNTTGDIGTPSPEFPINPYFQAAPINPANHHSAVGITPSPNIGWIYKVSGSDYTLQAVNTTGNALLTY